MVGVVGLVFEGNQLVIPIQECVRAEDRDRFPRAFRWTMSERRAGAAQADTLKRCVR